MTDPIKAVALLLSALAVLLVQHGTPPPSDIPQLPPMETVDVPMPTTLPAQTPRPPLPTTSTPPPETAPPTTAPSATVPPGTTPPAPPATTAPQPDDRTSGPPTGAVPTPTPPAAPSPTAATQLQVGQDAKHLAKADGTPFFWMGDTAWSLFVNLNRDQTIQYLDNRAAKGFTVIQAVAVSTPSGGLGPNAHGDAPHAGDIAAPTVTQGNDPADEAQYDYWDHVEFVIAQAAQRGMYIALLPAWSSATAGESLTAGNAEAYGTFLGTRLGKQYSNIVWMMGGDDNEGFFPEIWAPLAKGVTVGATGTEDYSKTLMTYHPGGGKNSASELSSEPWLDFNTHQSGHARIDESSMWQNIELSSGVSPAKPFLDSEPGYEQHPIEFDAANGYLGEYDVRAFAYFSVFSGAAGHTYGHHNIWMMYGAHLGGDGAEPMDIPWDQAMDAPGAQQMKYLSDLMQAHPVARVADQSLITSGAGDSGGSAIRALRSTDGSYLMVYTGAGNGFSLDTSSLTGTTNRAYWLDPRTGAATDAGAVTAGATQEFTPPAAGENNDWVLVIEDTAKGFPFPGGDAVAPAPAAA